MGGAGAVTARTKCFPARGWNAAAKLCDCCNSAAALLFCRAESAFMCMSCDVKVHDSNHERVWLCEVCEQAPAAVTCKADSAALCISCDTDIHCANPLARRHERIPVLPFYDTAESVVMNSASAAPLPDPLCCSSPPAQNSTFITDSSNLISPINVGLTKINSDDVKTVELLFSDTDLFLNFDGYRISPQPFSDRVVPVHAAITKPPVPGQLTDHSPENQFSLDFKRYNYINSYSNSYNTAASLSHSISSSSMEVGVVPDGNQAAQVIGLNREARVLRYREKKKNRKFEKTIRYASRKAYAETRPRIKGRFVKRTDADSDVDRFFSPGDAEFMSGTGYGVVPTFYA